MQGFSRDTFPLLKKSHQIRKRIEEESFRADSEFKIQETGRRRWHDDLYTTYELAMVQKMPIQSSSLLRMENFRWPTNFPLLCLVLATAVLRVFFSPLLLFTNSSSPTIFLPFLYPTTIVWIVHVYIFSPFISFFDGVIIFFWMYNMKCCKSRESNDGMYRMRNIVIEQRLIWSFS